MKRKVLILGGGYAGVIASNRLAKLDKELEITLLNKDENFVERIRNHEKATGKSKKEFHISELLSKRVKFRKGNVLKIFPDLQEVVIANSEPPLRYDSLIYALGSTQHATSISVQNVITKENSETLCRKLQPRSEGTAWVIGGGLTGIELATEIKDSYPHWNVGLVDRGKFASTFSTKAQEYLRKIFSKMEITIEEKTEVARMEKAQLHLTNGRIVPCQLLISTSGFSSSEVAKNSGFRTNDRNQIRVNQYLQVPDYPNVFVAGDACYMENSFLRMGCVTALPLGIQAAENVYKYLKDQKMDEFSFRFMGRNVSLGRKEGLIQMTDEKDSPVETIFTGSLAAFLKEMICKYTLLSIRLEKWLPFRTYSWPRHKTKNQNQKFETSYE